MNLAMMLADNEKMTVRELLNQCQHMVLKKGLVSIGKSENTAGLWGFRDEIIAWDEHGNTLMFHYVNGMGFKTVTLRKPGNPNRGVILASLRETQRVEYFPEAADGEDSNNLLHFYRSEHPDAAPFLSLSPLWLLLPEFHVLLSSFPEGDFSALDSITEILDPQTGLSAMVRKQATYAKTVMFPEQFELIA